MTVKELKEVYFKREFKVDNEHKYMRQHFCSFSGDYFVDGDVIIMFIVWNSAFIDFIKDMNLKSLLRGNFWAKKELLEEIFERHIEDKILDYFLIDLNNSIKRKKKLVFNDDMLKRIDVFKKACMEYKFYPTVDKNKQITICKKRGFGLTIRYNVLSDVITTRYNGRMGLFDRLYINEFEVKIRNKMNELLGIDERNDFTAKGAINEAIKKTNEMFNK